MASQISGCCESVHGLFRPVLKKFEMNTVFGIFDLRVGSMIAAVLMIVYGGLNLLNINPIHIAFAVAFVLCGILLLIAIFMNLRNFIIPSLVVSFLFIFIGLIKIIFYFASWGWTNIILESIYWILNFILFIIVYSYNEKIDDLPGPA